MAKLYLRLIILITILLLPSHLEARKQVQASCSVRDGFLEIPLAEAKVTLLDADSVKIQDIEIVKFTEPDGRLLIAQIFVTLDCGKKYILHGTLDGYDDAWLDIDVPQDASAQINPGDLNFHRRQTTTLDGIVVKATKVKMVWKGDTLVYNADAFNLPKGSMLDDLIRQMPGVTMNDNGEIFVNGRKVDELLLGSKSFFRGKSEVLLRNLPYYTVKNIKVYDKQSEMSEMAGYDVAPKKYVMDVNLKQEYNSGIIANVEAGAGSSKRYLGRAFLLGYADPFRFSLVGNLNNVNESRHIGQSGSWTPEKLPKSLLTTRSVAGELTFENRKIVETINIEYSSSSNTTDMHRRSELFLEGSKPLSVTQSTAEDDNRMLKVHNHFRLKKPFIDINLDYHHRKFNSLSNSTTQQSDDEVISNMYSEQMRTNGQVNELNATVQGFLSLNRNLQSDLNYYAVVKHVVEGSDGLRHYKFTEPVQSPLININNYHDRSTSELFWLMYRPFRINGIGLTVEEQISMQQDKKHDYLYHPDTLMLPSQKDALLAITDFSNSYRSRSRNEFYTTTLILNKQRYLESSETMRMPYAYNLWELSLGISPRHQSLYYHRGKLDTHVTSNIVVFTPTLKINYFPTNRYERQLDFMITHFSNDPSLFDRIDYRDDSQPLIVKLGNPDLKATRITQGNVNYYSRGAHGQLFHAMASFDYWHRATAQSVCYDPLTGVYTYRPVNVKGNYVGKINVDVTRPLGRNRHWTLSNNAEGMFNHNVDHTMLQGETQSRENKVNTLTLHDGMYVQFEKGGINVRATGDVRWRHTTGKMDGFSTLNAVDFQYGLSARYTVPVLGTTFSADGTMFSRRGYGSASLNSNDFILNASVSQPLLKGKLVARIEGFDLLHQLSQTQYEVNAQGRVETWIRTLPHYVMFHLVWNFSLTPRR